MQTLIYTAELKKYPGVELEIFYQLDLQEVVIFFSFYQENEKGIRYTKKYSNKEDALNSVQIYVSSNESHEDIQSKDNSNTQYVNYNDFIQTMKKQKMMFLRDIVNNKVNLPDEGKGFILDGDVDYIKKLISNYKFD